ncbi:GNAT family N-acetyltransferase [Alicyclobacillus ferrooxydans]|uniref:bifunctional acetate--CoA ligase family protein/GNAT family N-acetyltransferase n=1 Tax=Alicyclobacillus ferrooxydans TaxID=471514 RepID=UPI0006D56874|nr:GNAT family N-acetyltransferase [Alicyclobacillus ferrooxydans]
MSRVILRDGRVAEVRRAHNTEEDRQLVRALFAHASPESLYYRFFHMVREVSEDILNTMLTDDGNKALSLICVAGDKAIGIGTYVRQDELCAEVALLVNDNLHGKGIGTLLLEHLAHMAWRYGIRRFEATVLSDNQKMLQVFHASGFENSRRRLSDVYELTLPLAETERIRALQDTREKLSTAASLMPFFQPKAIAVVGASRDPRRLGHMLFRHVLGGEFSGTVYPVNPSAGAVSGVRAYPDVVSIPEQVDLAIIVVPAWQVSSVVDDCIAAKVRAVLITSAGFGESGPEGVQLEQSILEKLRGAGIRLIGPNCLGLVSTTEDVQLNASFAPFMPLYGSMAIASQSGALGIAILEAVSRSGIGVSSFCSTGNKADVSSNDLLLYWEDDAQTKLITLYLESFGNPRKFSRIARRLSRKKPILVVKGARTAEGVQVSRARTAALSGHESTVEALFRQTGIIRLDSLQEVFDVALMLNFAPLPRGKKIAVVTNTAGGAVMSADALGRSGLDFVGPPIDLGFEALPQGYRDVLPHVLRDPNVDGVLVLFSQVGLSEEESVSAAIIEAVKTVTAEWEAAGIAPKPVVGNFLMTGEPRLRTIGDDTCKIPVYPYPEQAALALAKVSEYAQYLHRPLGHIPDMQDLDCHRARSVIRTWLDDENADSASERCLPPSQCQEVLMSIGLPLAPGNTADKLDHCVRVVITSHPLFGPTMQLHRDSDIAGSENSSCNHLPSAPDKRASYRFLEQARATKLIPLTDVDAADLVGQVVVRAVSDATRLDTGDYDTLLAEALLRISRLVDDAPEIKSMTLSFAMSEGIVRTYGCTMQVNLPI